MHNTAAQVQSDVGHGRPRGLGGNFGFGLHDLMQLTVVKIYLEEGRKMTTKN